jgi:hypothetical protein
VAFAFANTLGRSSAVINSRVSSARNAPLAFEWGERSFQVRDPNGVIIQLVDWNASTQG